MTLVYSQNHPRSVLYVKKIASIPNYQITEADIKRIHGMVAEHLVAAGQYRDHNLGIAGAKFIPPSFLEVSERTLGRSLLYQAFA